MQAEVVHHVPGRLRLRLPELRNCSDLSTWIKGPMGTQPGIGSVRVNPWCASVVIYYDAGVPNFVRELLAALEFFAIESASALPAKAEPAAPIRGGIHGLWEWLRESSKLLCSSLALSTSLLGQTAGAFALPLICWTAIPSLTRAFKIIRLERRLNVDFLDSIAVFVSVGRRQFFTAAFMTWMISLGDWIRDRTAARSKRVITGLLEFQTVTAWVIKEGKVTRVPSSAIQAGDSVIVYPGEIIPVDGVIVRGRATVDQKTITGESLPLERGPGDDVFASTVIREGKLTLC
ncbi:MAG: hypothetical protein JOZ62_20165, partial [Acidobacteriaceae bacterium]|nr:hypothetical protein [Acidobacteriaceae bacterium]